MNKCMAKYKVTFDRNTCIGAFACVAADPEHWKYADDGKVDLEPSEETGEGTFTLIVDENEVDLEALKASAEACPVYAIKVEEVQE